MRIVPLFVFHGVGLSEHLPFAFFLRAHSFFFSLFALVIFLFAFFVIVWIARVSSTVAFSTSSLFIFGFWGPFDFFDRPDVTCLIDTALWHLSFPFALALDRLTEIRIEAFLKTALQVTKAELWSELGAIESALSVLSKSKMCLVGMSVRNSLVTFMSSIEDPSINYLTRTRFKAFMYPHF